MSNMKLFKAAGFLISIIIFYIMAIPLHEWFHYVAGAMEHVSGSVTYPGLFGGFYVFTPMPSHPWIIYLAGGYGVAFIYYLVWWFAWKNPSKWDLDDEVAVALVGATQFGYAIGELGWGVWNWPMWISYLLAVAGAGIVIAIYIPRMIEWILQKGEGE